MLERSRELLSSTPCDLLGEELLEGNRSRYEEIEKGLGVPAGSWLPRELILGQIKAVAARADAGFLDAMPSALLSLGHRNAPVHRGLACLVNRYAEIQAAEPHVGLRDEAVNRWGNPFLPSNDLNWRHVKPNAKRLLQNWMKRDFINAFFSKLVQDRLGDPRRARFWLRYVGAIDQVHFALGSHALSSTHPDFVTLRQQMAGLYSPLRGAGSNNNAFIMSIGQLVVVEFGDSGACYGYHLTRHRPFSLNEPLDVTVDATNSLKHSSNAFRLSHQNQLHGYDRWEQRFDSELSRFGIRGISEDETLMTWARERGLRVEDRRPLGGYFTVHADNRNPGINRQLAEWGFRYRPSHGWYRE